MWNKPTSEYNLEILFPSIAKLLHPIKNPGITTSSITPYSHRKLFWICPQSTADAPHEWEATVYNLVKRVTKNRKGTGCPFCAKHNGKFFKNQSAGFLFAHIKDQWDYSENKTSPFDHQPSSHHMAAWKCPNGKLEKHKWRQRIYERVGFPSCPFCTGRKACRDNSIRSNPELLEEWNYNENLPATPDNTSIAGIKIYVWTCRFCKHNWKASIYRRIKTKTGCPKCFRRTSYLELFIYSQLKWVFPDTENRHRIASVEVDCCSESEKIIVELDGFPWHKNKELKDKKKTSLLESLGFAVFRLRDHQLGKICESDILVGTENKTLPLEVMQQLMSKIETINTTPKIKQYLLLDSLPNMEYFQSIAESIPQRKPLKNLGVTHPKLKQYWSYPHNKPIHPEHVTHGSRRIMTWYCKKHKYIWSASIRQTTKNIKFCPDCKKLHPEHKRQTIVNI